MRSLLSALALVAVLALPGPAGAWGLGHHCCHAQLVMPVAPVAFAPAAMGYAAPAYGAAYAHVGYSYAPAYSYVVAPVVTHAIAAPVGSAPMPTGPAGSPITTVDDTSRAIGRLNAALADHGSAIDRLTAIAGKLADGQNSHEARLTAIERKLAAPVPPK